MPRPPRAGSRTSSSWSPGWAHAAGYAEVTASASTWCFATPADRGWWGGMWADRILQSDLARQLQRDGLASQRRLEEISVAWRSWAADSDGWLAIVHGEILHTA
ncbi:MAG: hypothetical protein ACLQDY_08990 [Streptosporangiaceae bacterium]